MIMQMATKDSYHIAATSTTISTDSYKRAQWKALEGPAWIQRYKFLIVFDRTHLSDATVWPSGLFFENQ